MKPTICSFYTQEYEYLASWMMESAWMYGYDTDVQQIEKINNSWLDTIYYRPEFIKNMLSKHDGDVVWLDCDAVIRKEPVLFSCFEADFGIHIHDFPWRKNEYLGGTMYFSNNVRTKKFLDVWIELNQKMPKQKLSQWIIPHAIKECQELLVFNLPAQYCQIFDHMKDCGDPVILHQQASRKFRNKI